MVLLLGGLTCQCEALLGYRNGVLMCQVIEQGLYISSRVKPRRLSWTGSWLGKTALQQGSVQLGGCACENWRRYRTHPHHVGLTHFKVFRAQAAKGAGEADSEAVEYMKYQT